MLSEKYADQIDEKGQRYLAFISEGGEKAQAMLDGLIQLSRLTTQGRPFTTTDCHQAVDQCQQALKETVNGCGARINVAPLPQLHADPVQLKQLLTALLDNALKFRHPEIPPNIQIYAELQADGMWQICVEDNGIGIDHSFHERIFQLFKRLHTDKEYPGIGMGLTLARAIAERHGGSMWLESEHGKGSRFFFTMPAASEATAYDTVILASQPSSSSNLYGEK